MLYSSQTTSALVAGIEFESPDAWTPRKAEAIRDALRRHNTAHDTALELIVPGDSATEHADKPDKALYGWGLMIGLLPSSANSGDGPREVDIDAAHRALRRVCSFPRDYWRELASRHELLESIEGRRPGLFLTSFGPLPSGLLAVGQKHPSTHREHTRYQFFGVPDSRKCRDEDGVDGIDIAYVDFADFIELDLSPDAVESWLSKVPKLDEPGLFLATRAN